MDVIAFVLGLIALYLLLGARSYRARRRESGSSAGTFALGELGGAVRIAAAWMLWPFVPWPDEDAEH